MTKNVIVEERPKPKTSPPTTKPTSKKTTTDPKAQKVKVLVSVLRYGDKIVSAFGIPTPDAWVSHKILKESINDEAKFNIISHLANSKHFRSNERWHDVAQKALDNKSSEIIFPSERAIELSSFDFGKLKHEILNIKIDLFIT